jgi:hypothetical protein
MLKIFKNFNINIIALILLVIYCIWASIALQNYQKIDKNNIPAFIIQESKLSKKSINDFTKIGDAKNIWLIADDNDFKKANELIKQSADAISYANQIGRLDLVSIFLAIIAVILGLFGIVGFLHVKAMVKAEIDRIAPVEINEFLKKYFKENSEGQRIIEKYIALEFNKRDKDLNSEVEDQLNV